MPLGGQLLDLGALLIDLSNIRDRNPGRLQQLIQSRSSEGDRNGKKNE